MTTDSGSILAELSHVREILQKSIDGQTKPSPLTIARVVDLSRAALTGEATQSVIEGLAKAEQPAQAAIDVIDAAIRALKSDVVLNLTRPDFSAQLQSHLAMALLESKWVKFSLIGLVTAYAVAAALLILPIRDAFGSAGEAARLLQEAKAVIAETGNKLAEAKQLVTDVSGRIDAVRNDFAQILERIVTAKQQIGNLESDLANRRRDLEMRLGGIETTVERSAADARARIGEMPQQAYVQIQRAFADAEGLAVKRLGDIKISADRLEQQAVQLDKSVLVVDSKVASFATNLDQTINRLAQREQLASDTFARLPERIDALFAGRDQHVATQITAKLASLGEKYDAGITAAVAPLIDRLGRRTAEEEGKISSNAGALLARLNSLGDDLKEREKRISDRTDAAVTAIDDLRGNSKGRLDSLSVRIGELEGAANTLEQRRRQDEARYGSIAVFADRSRDIESRLDTSDDRLRALNKSAAPIEELIAALNDRAGPVAQLLAQAMAATNAAIADQIWLMTRPNRTTLLVLSGFAIVTFLWLVGLTFFRRRRPA